MRIKEYDEYSKKEENRNYGFNNNFNNYTNIPELKYYKYWVTIYLIIIPVILIK